MNTITIDLKGVNSYLIPAGNGYILVDAGFPGSYAKIANALSVHKIDVKNIKLIIITHVHGDHVGALADIVKNSGAKVLVHESEEKILAEAIMLHPKGTNLIGKFFAMLSPLLESKIKFTPVKADITMKDELDLASYGVNGKIYHTPGHTEGSISVILDSGETFVGDACMHFSKATVFPLFANDEKTLLSSWALLLNKGPVKFYPGHGKEFDRVKLTDSLDRVKKKIFKS